MFLLFGIVLVAANVSSLARVRGIESPILLADELVGTAIVVVSFSSRGRSGGSIRRGRT